MSKTKKEREDWDDKLNAERNKRRKSQVEIMNSYETGEYEEEEFYYEQREKFKPKGKRNQF